MHPTASAGVTLGIVVLSLVVTLALLAGLRHVRPSWTSRAAVVAIVWLVASAAAGASGVLRNFEARPPPMALMFVVVLSGGVVLGVSRVGKALAELPIWVLVVAQAFRLPLELVMHAAASEGTMPHVMTWTGLNYDVVAGAAALVVGLALRRGAGRWLAGLWLALATGTLTAIVIVAFLASPMMKRFGPDEVNTWVAYAPFVWLPSVLVLSALTGQIVLFRALRARHLAG